MNLYYELQKFEFKNRNDFIAPAGSNEMVIEFFLDPKSQFLGDDLENVTFVLRDIKTFQHFSYGFPLVNNGANSSMSIM